MIRFNLLIPALALSLWLLPAHRAAAQPAPRELDRSSIVIDGPPPPVAPAVVARDEEGRVTIRAVRLKEPLDLDARLDEAVYREVPAIEDFVQQEPREGQPGTERTEAWIFFDDRNVYVAVRCWETRPERIVANEMRRDHINIFRNDSITVVFDTYYDRRSGFLFQTNPLGAFRDGLIVGESNTNFDWNAVWDVKSRRFEGGWITEIAVPFKSLRYVEGREQVWGVNVRRTLRAKNETTHFTRIPASYTVRGVMKLSSAATLVGIETPAQSRNLEIKPYAISSVTTNRDASPPTSNDFTGDLGFDVKYGLTRSLIADFTYNTDFAQVEADDQQVNLTRFSLLFPEKREFFLEGQGTFDIAAGRGDSDVPIIFFSRRIGLNNGQTVPIDAGGRLTGRAGKYTLGMLNIQTGDSEIARATATNFSVARVKRDVLRRSSIGVIATSRSPAVGGGSNQAVAADALLNFYQDLQISGYYAQTMTEGAAGDTHSYQGQFTYSGDRYGLDVGRLKVGDAFNPEIGFVRRADFLRHNARGRFSPRLTGGKAVRKLRWEGGTERAANGEGRLETRETSGSFGLELENGDTTEVTYAGTFEFLPQPFSIAPDVVVPVGGYAEREVRASYSGGPQRRIEGTMSLVHGGLYGGDRTQVGYNGRLQITPQFSIEPRVSVNWVALPQGEFTTKLVSARVNITLTPRAAIGSLVQYSSTASTVSTDLRFRWEYRPSSNLFLVFNEGRNPALPDTAELRNRTVAVKVTRLLRF